MSASVACPCRVIGSLSLVATKARNRLGYFKLGGYYGKRPVEIPHGWWPPRQESG